MINNEWGWADRIYIGMYVTWVGLAFYLIYLLLTHRCN